MREDVLVPQQVEQSVHDVCHGFEPGWDHGGSVVTSVPRLSL